MAAAPPAEPGRIFISYRREETAYPAGWLFDKLVERFGEGRVFKDVDSIEIGEDFVEAITNAVGSCTVLLALIGDQWLTIADDGGGRRIDNADDFVRLEIEAALARDVLVIPVLVEGAEMPDADKVPPTLAPLTRRQALELSPNRFAFDTSRLLTVLDKTVGDPLPAPSAEAPSRRWYERFSKAGMTVAAGTASAVALIAAVAIVGPNWGDGSPGGGEPPPLVASSIFKDDFSTRANNWNDTGNARDGGHYSDGAYRIHTTWTEDHFSDHGFPRGARRVYPTAPRDVRVSVRARPLSGEDGDAGYGIACRADGTERYYELAIWQGQAVIAKVIPGAPYYIKLDSAAAPLMGGSAMNRLEATCTTSGAQAVDLAFRVNGKSVARATDSDDPLPAGAVGLLVATGGEDAGAIEAEFDDFAVARG